MEKDKKDEIIKELEQQIQQKRTEREEYKIITAGGVLLTLFFGIGILYIIWRAFQKHELRKRIEILEDKALRLKTGSYI